MSSDAHLAQPAAPYPAALTTLGSTATRKARLRSYPPAGIHNSLYHFPKVTGGYLRVIRNSLLIIIARYAPFFWLKTLIYRALGMRVGKHTAIGLMVMMDIFFPQDITIGDDTLIGYNSVILCHEFMRHEWRRGPVVIGRDVTIGANTTILPGVVIGDGATISAMSLSTAMCRPAHLSAACRSGCLPGHHPVLTTPMTCTKSSEELPDAVLPYF